MTQTFTGVFSSASKVTGAVGKGFAALSMDEQFIREVKRCQILRQLW